MKSRIRTRKKSTGEQTPDFSKAPAQPMFESRPFVVQTQQAQKSQQPDLKTALMRAQRYGHHLSRILPTSLSAPTAVQPKMGIGQSVHEKRAKAPQVIQAKLSVGAPSDMYEREADAVAVAVVDRIHGGGENSPGLESVQSQSVQQRKKKKFSQPLGLNIQPLVQREASGGVQEAKPHLEQSIEHKQGGGQSLSNNIQKPMEQAFGADFSGVKIHTDAQSDQLNQSIQAKAFTTGQDIFFRQGAYDPGSRGGQELIAHELTHVVQQNGGAVQRQVIQRAIDTIGGEWKTNKYQPVMEEGIKPGAEIELEFVPNQLVNSKKIGLLQKIEKIHNGRNLDQEYAIRKGKGEDFAGKAEKTAANRTEGRGHWDRGLDKTNPVYGAKDLKPGESVSKTPESKLDMDEATPTGKKSNYQLGYRYKSFPGLKWNERSAKLYDKPNMPSAKTGSEMIFETTAMSLEGSQKNVYYGSVKWGWKINNVADPSGGVAATDIELEPLAVVEMGTPSAEMKELADIWNQGKTYTRGAPDGVPNTQIPTTNHTTTLSQNELQDPKKVELAIKDLKDELAHKLPENDQQNKQFELKFLKQKLQELR